MLWALVKVKVKENFRSIYEVHKLGEELRRLQPPTIQSANAYLA